MSHNATQTTDDRFEPETAQRVSEGATVEDPNSGNHYEVTRDGMFSVELEGIDTNDSPTVDKRNWPGRFVVEEPA